MDVCDKERRLFVEDMIFKIEVVQVSHDLFYS